MIKQDITYTNFEGEQETETLYFHLNKVELMEMQVSEKRGLAQYITDIQKAENNKEIFRLFKEIVLRAYGERSEDGKKFIKNERLREEFEGCLAYEELMVKIVTETDFAVKFVNGIMPAGMADQIAARMGQDPLVWFQQHHIRWTRGEHAL